MMQDPRVIHLVSNSLDHPENTASNFKVSYNVPFDLTGKKIALIDTTLTKAQPNVLEEKIVFIFPYVVNKADHHKILMLEPRKAGRPATIAPFFAGYNKELRQEDGSTLLRCTAYYNSNKVSVRITNGSYHQSKVAFYNEFKTTTSIGWKLMNDSQTGIARISDRVPEVEGKPKLYTKVIPAKNTRVYEFELFDGLGEAMVNSQTFPKVKKALAIVVQAYPFTLQQRKTVECQPGPGNFSTIVELIEHINALPSFALYAQLLYQKGRVTLKIKNDVDSCDIDLGGLERHLGFDTRVIKYIKNIGNVQVAQGPPNMTRGTHHFYIYCSLIKEVAVNNQQVPILATVDATKGDYGQQITHPVRYPLFVDCVEGPQQMVEVTIADDTGNSKGLLMGRTKLTLMVSSA